METLFCQHSTGASDRAVRAWDSRPGFGPVAPSAVHRAVLREGAWSG